MKFFKISILVLVLILVGMVLEAYLLKSVKHQDSSSMEDMIIKSAQAQTSGSVVLNKPSCSVSSDGFVCMGDLTGNGQNEVNVGTLPNNSNIPCFVGTDGADGGICLTILNSNGTRTLVP
jgi:hypothetical protein